MNNLMDKARVGRIIALMGLSGSLRDGTTTASTRSSTWHRHEMVTFTSVRAHPQGGAPRG